MRPVVAGIIQYHELLDGTYGLDHIADINEAMDIESENQYRINEAMRKNNGRI